MRVLISSKLVSRDLSKPTGPSLPVCSCLDLSAKLLVDGLAFGPSIAPKCKVLILLYQNERARQSCDMLVELVRLLGSYR